MTHKDTNCPLPTRQQWQTRDVTLSGELPAVSAKPRRRRAFRSLVLASLAALTVAAPISGFVNGERSIAIPVREIGTPVAGTTWVGAQGSLVEADALGENLAAASRARARTPITVDACVAAETVAAGERTIVKQELIYWPMGYGTYNFTSPFGYRLHPVLGTYTMHNGIDLSAPLGTPLYSVADGVVERVEYNGGMGGYTRIRHQAADGSVYYTQYLHQDLTYALVSPGDTVSAGQRIGSVGNTGWSTGPHLHFEVIYANEEYQDPMAWLEEVGAVFLGQEC
ncbi:M23 family metallopeptidase [Schaalia suimastitidis]|uniref:M23 family metallopeptidase n=1 Tax=Schaalia suimastitidis TaxID=121163 RepID=UPI0003F9BAD2|nr:M23 family metallopeptidase [Schaalia suimastitidis]